MGIRRGEISTPIIADGLIFNMDAANRACYPRTGTNIINTSNTSISGSLVNDVGLFTNPLSFEFGLDGVDDYIDYGDHDIFSFGDGTNDFPFSINVWIKWDSVGTWKALVSKDGSGSTREWALLTAPSSYIRLFIKGTVSGGDQQDVNTSSTFSHSTWYNITSTYDGRGGADAADGLELYVNGINDTGTRNKDSDYVAMTPTTSPLEIGRYANSSIYATDGKIANVQIYNHALSATEVLHNYNALKGRFV